MKPFDGKYMWFVERRDSLGEFQPMQNEVFYSRESARDRLEKLASQGREDRFRIAPYGRREVRS